MNVFLFSSNAIFAYDVFGGIQLVSSKETRFRLAWRRTTEQKIENRIRNSQDRMPGIKTVYDLQVTYAFFNFKQRFYAEATACVACKLSRCLDTRSRISCAMPMCIFICALLRGDTYFVCEQIKYSKL